MGKQGIDNWDYKCPRCHYRFGLFEMMSEWIKYLSYEDKLKVYEELKKELAERMEKEG